MKQFSKHLHVQFAEHRLEGGLVDLLEHQRHRAYHIGTHLLHGFEQQGGRGGLAEEIDGAAARQGVEELKHHAVDVGHGEHRHQRVALLDDDILVGKLDGGRYVAEGQHHAFRGAGGAGGVVDDVQVGKVVDGKVQVVAAELAVETVVEVLVLALDGGTHGVVLGVNQRKVVHVDGTAKLGHLANVQLVPYLLVGKEQYAVRVVHQMVQAVGMEVHQDGHHDTFEGVDGQEGHAPACGVLGAQGDVVAFLEAGFFKHHAEFDDVLGQFGIGERFSVVVAKRWLVPAAFHAFFQR